MPSDPARAVHGVACNSQLPTLDSESVIENLRARHAADEVYTWTGTILLAVNPYKALPGLYGEEAMAETRGSKLLRAPHAYSVAERAFRQMAREGTNQSIVISGESGAGKTENCRIILQYLAARSRTEASLVETRLLAANPILESFGCAKTLRNNNSSRFGKLVKTYFDGDNKISASTITTYLLEKSRLVFHGEGERNYHIFYQLAAATASGHALATELAPNAATGLAYLARGGAPSIDGVDDLAEFEDTLRTLRLVGVEGEQLRDVLRVLGGVLELGEVRFVEDEGGQAQPADEAVVRRAAQALGMGVEQLHRCLRTRTVVSGRGSAFTVHFSAAQAATARDSLAKAVYERLFSWLVGAANASLLVAQPAAPSELEAEHRFIATLDIFGFENFESNSFEQLLINYCNEKLQHQFLCHVVQQEQQLYAHESIQWKHLSYANNADAVALFEAYPTGVLWLMQEYARLPSRESAQEVEKKLTQRIHAAHRGSAHLSVPRTRRGHALNSDDGFIVRHFAGDVCYSTAGFLEKNAENLHAELELLVSTSGRECVALHGGGGGGNGEPADPQQRRKSGLPAGAPRRGAGNTRTVATGFMNQLSSLVQTLQLTATHYVRALKPNGQQAAGRFCGELVKKQLDDSGMPQVLTLMHSGYPTRCPFSSLYERYRPRAPAYMACLEPRVFIEGLLYALGVPAADFQLGLSQLFFKGAGQMAFLESLLETNLLSTPAALARMKRWIVLKRFHLALSSAKVAVRFGRRLEMMRQATKLAQLVRVVVRARRALVPRARAAKRVIWRRYAGEVIASAWRARALRRLFAASRAAIVMLQAHGRRLAVAARLAALREAARKEAEARRLAAEKKAARSIRRGWQCKAARAELAALRAVKAARRATFREARRARDLERAQARAATRLQAAARRLAALRRVGPLRTAAAEATEHAAAARAARARERKAARAVKAVQRHWRGLQGRRTAGAWRGSLSREALAEAQARRSAYVGSLREAALEVAAARDETAKAHEKTWGYQELLQSAGTVYGPDCSPIGPLPLPTPAKSSRLSLLGMLRPSAGKKGSAAVAPSPAAPPLGRMSSLDIEPGKGDPMLGLMSRSADEPSDAAAGPAGAGRAVLSPRGGNRGVSGTPPYGKKGSGAGEALSAKRRTSSGTGTPKYGSSKKEQAPPAGTAC